MQKFWVIRKQPYRENSALLTVLADNNRLTRCITRDGIKASEFQPLFGLLTLKKISQGSQKLNQQVLGCRFRGRS